MINRDQVPNRSAVDLSTVIPWTNDAGEEIPAYGVVQLRTDFDTTSHASKPDSSVGLFFVNGPVPIASAKRGESLVWNRPRVVLLDAAASVGDEVGPSEGSWLMEPGGSGFRVLKQAADGRGVVVQVGAGSGGGLSIWFEIESVVCADDGSKSLFVTPTYYTGSCDASIPGEDSYGQVAVEDPCSILSYYTADWLGIGGVIGRATYMYPRGAEYCEGVWLVDAICGSPECA